MVRLYPTPEQEEVLWKSAGVARWAYNYWLATKKEQYEQGIKVSLKEATSTMTQIRNSDEYPWLKEVSAEIPKQAIKDLFDAYENFFKGTCNYPKFKKKGKCKVSFFHLNNKFIVTDEFIQLEKVGKVKYQDEGRLPRGNYKKEKIKVTNPRIKHNGKYWYLSLGFEHQEEKYENLTDVSLGIDLGIKDLAICSDGNVYKNINKTSEMKRLNKKLKRLQRKASRKYEFLKKDKTFEKGEKPKKTKNIIKIEKQIKLVYRRIANIRHNYLHQTTNRIVKTKPYRIVVEDLNVKGMMKNRHLSKAIQEQCFYELIRQLNYKCEFRGIEFIKVDRFYPSSKTCSNCGYVKKDLKLKDRTYVCPECGLAIDRDYNASINLANYQLV